MGTKGGHWTERSEGSGWSDSGTPYSLFFAKQKATQRIKIENLTFVLFKEGLSPFFTFFKSEVCPHLNKIEVCPRFNQNKVCP